MSRFWEKHDSVATAMCEKAVIYIRNSADIGQENSCDIQEEKCRAFAEKHGFEVVAVFADRGKSGLNAEGRPGFQALLVRVKIDDSFRYIIVLDISRWGRFPDTDLSAHYESICRQHGKEVIFVSHGIVEKDRRRKPLSLRFSICSSRRIILNNRLQGILTARRFLLRVEFYGHHAPYTKSSATSNMLGRSFITK